MNNLYIFAPFFDKNLKNIQKNECRIIYLSGNLPSYIKIIIRNE